VSTERQRHVFRILFSVLGGRFTLESKEKARTYFYTLRQRFLDYNSAEWDSDDFKRLEAEIVGMIEEVSDGLEPRAEKLMKQRGQDA
jgi:V/A-type H+-transporting ATPase subunit A